MKSVIVTFLFFNGSIIYAVANPMVAILPQNLAANILLVAKIQAAKAPVTETSKVTEVTILTPQTKPN